jgi:hypothetical protein
MLVPRELLVHLALTEHLDPMELLVHRELPVLLVPLGSRAPLDLLDRRDLLGQPESTHLQETKD